MKTSPLRTTTLLGLVATALLAAPPADARWEGLTGSPACGGILPDGTLQPGCDVQPATLEGNAVGECPAGSFFDIGTWSCYQCPAGYDRTGNSVTEWDACSKDVPDERAHALFEGADRCPAGSFVDGRNQGECWSCPDGYGRTAAAVNEWNACGMIFKEAVSATFHGRACGDDAFFDPRNGGECWSCPAGYLRTAAAVDQWNACVREVDLRPAQQTAALTCEADQVFDFVDGGTCWSCPDQYVRSWSSVKADDACVTQEMIWNIPERTMPGLFGLRGAGQIAAQLVLERTLIADAIRAAAEAQDLDPEAFAAEEWERIDVEPWYSPMLTTAVLQTALEAVKRPAAERSDAEHELILSLSQAIQDNRLFLATQSKQAFDNARLASQKRLTRQQGQLGSMFSTSPTLADYSGIARGVLGSSAGAALLSAGALGLSGAFPQFAAIAPHALMEGVRTGVEVGMEVAVEIGKNAVAATGKLTTAGNSLSAIASAGAGPLIIVSAAAVVLQLELDKVASIERQEGQIRQALDKAQRPVDLAVLLEAENGMEEIAFHWAALIDAPTRPDDSYYARLAADAADTGADGTLAIEILDGGTIGGGDWEQLPGSAVDVGIGANGSVWAAGTDAVYQWTGQAWRQIGGEVSRIAVDADGTPWVVAIRDSRVLRWNGSAWVEFDRPDALDIGVGVAGHVWVAGSDNAYRWNGSGWDTVGGLLKRVAVDGGGFAWAIAVREDRALRWDGWSWTELNARGRDIDVGPDGTVYLTHLDGAVSRWNPDTGNWDRVAAAGTGVSVAVGPAGNAWVVRDDETIWRMP